MLLLLLAALSMETAERPPRPRETDRLLGLNAVKLAAAVKDIPTAWQTDTGVRLRACDWASGQWLSGLFEYWLHAEGARRMGAESYWEDLRIAAACVGGSNSFPDVCALPSISSLMAKLSRRTSRQIQTAIN